MRHKNSDIVTWIVMSVVGVVILGFMVYKLSIYLNDTSDATDRILEKAREQVDDMIESEIAMYDGETIRGDELRNLIKEQLGEYSADETAPIYVKVTTVTNGTTYINTYQNKQYISYIKDISSYQYFIKPTAYFKGAINRSTNQAILGITFVQK